MLRIENLSVSYDNKLAVDNLSIYLRTGMIYGLVGPNGAGKSTVIKTITGLLPFYAGKIYYNEYLLKKNRQQIRKLFGYAPEDPELLPYLTGREFLSMIAGLRQTADIESQVHSLIELAGLSRKADELIKSYSHGMRQKVSLAGALIGNPPFLILDEALNGLDPVSLYNIRSYLQQRAKSGAVILLASHVLELVENWCDRVIVMHRGKLLGEFDPKEETEKPFSEKFIELIKAANQAE